MPKNIYIETYGCQMNEYDTELIRSILMDSGYSIIDKVSDADIVMLNTCSVRDSATRKILNRVHTVRQENTKPDLLVSVLGCMATDFKKDLLDNRKLKINFIAGPDSYRRLPELIENAKEKNRPFDLGLSEFEMYQDIDPVRTDGVNAWIAIMRGCNNFCSFCVVPYTRGRERSQSVDKILNEAKNAVMQGKKQITLLGQNVNSYRYNDNDFSDLISRLSEINGLYRIRFTSPHPKDFSDKLIKVMSKKKNICKHIHLPLQSGNTGVLEKMNRGYSKSDYLDLVDKIRKLIPDIALTTDIIIGFPTETDEQFEDTLDVVEKVRFDSAFIFKYSPRKGTIAAKKYEDDVCDEIKTKRIVKLNELQKRISLEKNKIKVGAMQEILIEEKNEKNGKYISVGRNSNNMRVFVKESEFNIGEIVKVKITDATPNMLYAQYLP